MATIREIISDALQRIGIVAAGDEPSDADATSALRAYNDMVRGWKASGTDITIPRGETESTGAYADATLDTAWAYGDHHLRGVKALLAVELTSQHRTAAVDKVTEQVAAGAWYAIQAEFNRPAKVTVDAGLLRMPSSYRGGLF